MSTSTQVHAQVVARELIRLDDVHRAFGPLTVLEGINLRIDEGDRIGVVGHNGAGKTTLLRTISSQGSRSGDVTYAAGLRLAFLTQIRDIVEEATLGEELNSRGRQFQELEDEISKIEEMMADPGFYDGDWQPAMDRYQELQSLMARSRRGCGRTCSRDSEGTGFSTPSNGYALILTIRRREGQGSVGETTGRIERNRRFLVG